MTDRVSEGHFLGEKFRSILSRVNCFDLTFETFLDFDLRTLFQTTAIDLPEHFGIFGDFRRHWLFHHKRCFKWSHVLLQETDLPRNHAALCATNFRTTKS